MLRLSCFGGLRLSAAGTSVCEPALQPRRLALLALLAVSSEAGLSRDKLVAYVWPELPDERARHVLRQAIYALRSTLGATALREVSTALALNPAVVSSDVADFESAIANGRWQMAAEHYSGPFLDGFFIRDAQPFEEWVENQRLRFELAAASAFEAVAQSATTAGDHAQALNWHRRLAAMDPLNTRYAMMLVEAMASAGDIAGAVRFAARHQAVRREELGAGPDAALERLTRQLLSTPPSPPVAATRSIAAASDPAVSVLESRWRIERTLDRRAIATTYLVRDSSGAHQYLLKVLSTAITPMLDKGTLVKRLCAAVGLAHPSLVPMLEAGVIGEFVYCVMPFVEGASLRDRLEQEHQLSITEVVAMARALAGALAFGHAHRILHLDIRPKHILTGPPVPRLSEVGIASAVRATLAIAGQRTGLTLGAPAYMSPEQAAGQPDLDARSDLFSLGCVLYEALIGEPPLAAATPQALMLRRLTESVAPLRGLRDTVPRWLEAIILRLLARTPADRFASANELLTALDSADVDGAATQFPVRIRVAPEGPPLRSAP